MRTILRSIHSGLGRYQRLSGAMAGLLVLAGCSGEREAPNSPSQGRSNKSATITTEPKSKSGDPGKDPEPTIDGSLISAKYKVTATFKQTGDFSVPVPIPGLPAPSANGNIGTCGPAVFPMKVNSVFGSAEKGIPLIEIAEGQLSCKAMGFPVDLDLKTVLAVFSDPKTTPELTVESHVIHVNRLGDGMYSPPRPFLPSFLASKKEDIAAIDIVKDGVRLTSSSTDASATGKFHLRTVKIADKEVIEMGAFENVIQFETEISGFDDPKIVRIAHLLPDKVTFWIALKPLAIVRIRLEAPATLFAKVAMDNPRTIKGIAGNALGGLKSVIGNNQELTKPLDSLTDKMSVTVDLELLEQEGLTL